MIFKKIDLVLPPLDLTRIKGLLYESYGSEFFAFHIMDTQYLEEIISTRLKFCISPGLITYNEINGAAQPHNHSDEVATLNYYIDSCGAATWFYSPVNVENSVLSDRVLPDGSISDNTTITRYSLQDLKFLDKFCPRSGDAYIFDPAVIHSVQRFNNVTPRKLLRWVWDTGSFQEILDSIEILSPA